jgi:hypothetical protein
VTQTELETLVVRLVGDATGYLKMLNDATQKTKKVTEEVKKSLSQIENLTKNLEGFAGNAIKVLSSLGVATSLHGAFEKYAEHEKSVIRLKAAIESNGRAAEPVIENYEKFATTISNVTLTTKGATLALLQQAESMGLQDDQAKRAVKNAIALASARGMEAGGVLRLTAALERGETHGLNRFLRAELAGVKESDRARVAMEALAKKFGVATAEANSTAGRIERLHRSLAGLSKDVGEVVANAIRPLVEWVTAAVDAFKAADPSIKKIAVAAITAAGAFLAWKPAMAVLGPMVTAFLGLLKMIGGLPTPIALLGSSLYSIWTALKGIVRLLNPLKALGLLFNPWVIAIGGFALLITPLIKRMGGLIGVWEAIKKTAGDAWDWVTGKISEFIDWVQPVTFALGSLFSATWEIIGTAATDTWDAIKMALGQLWDYIASVWKDIVGDTKVNWNTIRDNIRDALFAAEFAIRNLDKVFGLAATNMEYQVVRFYNSVAYYFQQAIPAIFKWLADDAQNIFLQLTYNLSQMFLNLGQNIVNILKNIPDAIRGQGKQWEELWTEPLTKGFIAIRQELKLPEREISEVEKHLSESMAEQASGLVEQYSKFREQKLQELGVKPDEVNYVQKKAEELGLGIGQALNKGKEKEMHKFDAALIGSAEAFARIERYKDKLAGVSDKDLKAAGKPSASINSAEANAKIGKQVDLLSDIKGLLKQANDKPVMKLDTANLISL